MKIILSFLLLTVTLFAYEEDFTGYKDGTTLQKLTTDGITYTSDGSWEVFTTPFSIFETPVLLEPAAADENSPLNLQFEQEQCGIEISFATNGEDSVEFSGYLNGNKVFYQLEKTVNQGDLYSGSITINAQLDALNFQSTDKNKLIIDAITTFSCDISSYALTDDLILHETFDIGYDNLTTGVINSAITITSDTPTLEYDLSENVNTISFWINIDQFDYVRLIEAREDDTTSFNLNLSGQNLEADLIPNQVTEVSGSSVGGDTIDYELDTDNWHHIVMVNDNSTFKFYIDNKVVSDISETASSFEQIDKLLIALDQYTTTTVLLDDLRIYKRAFSASEIAELYAVRENFTDSYNAGKQFCIDNPEACGLKSATTSADISIERDISTLAESSFEFQWYFWSTDNGNAYLTNISSENPSVWQLVPETRQWKPVHNADAFDGFEAQGEIFESVTISEDGTSIIFGPAIEDNSSQ